MCVHVCVTETKRRNNRKGRLQISLQLETHCDTLSLLPLKYEEISVLLEKETEKGKRESERE